MTVCVGMAVGIGMTVRVGMAVGGRNQSFKILSILVQIPPLFPLWLKGGGLCEAPARASP